MPTILTLFSGIGLVEHGAKKAGYTPIGAVEYDRRIADIYALNHGDHVTVADIREVDPKQFDSPDVLWASPSCKPFSRARCDDGNNHPDADLGFEVIKFIDKLRPKWVYVENVPDFIKSPAFLAIADKLTKLGYWVSFGVLNAYDHGTPQSRRRLILIASRVNEFFLFTRKRGQDWRSALEGLSLPDAELLPVQAKFWHGQDMLIERIGYYREPKRAAIGEPCWTLRATLADDRKGHARNNFINAVIDGQVKNITPRAFARLMGCSDDFQLSGDIALDITGLGNGVCPPLVESILPKVA